MASLFVQLRPLTAKERQDLAEFRKFTTPEQLGEIQKLLKAKKAGTYYDAVKASFAGSQSYPQLNPLAEERNVMAYITDLNKIIRKKALEQSFYTFAKSAESRLFEIMAPNLGTSSQAESLRKAAVLQLFAVDKFHILILGEPSSGKEWVLRNTMSFSPVSEIYSSGQHRELVVRKEKRSFTKGLLPNSNHGTFCIQEFSLGKDELCILDAMEKGVVKVDTKAMKHEFKAMVNVLATATPKGPRFLVKSPELLKKQVPFDISLLTRFHLVFVLRDPDKPMPVRTAELTGQKLRHEDTEYIKAYVSYCRKTVEWNKQFDVPADQFIQELKVHESRYLVPVTERTAAAVKKLAKARAAMQLRTEVLKEDVDAAMDVVRKSLFLFE